MLSDMLMTFMRLNAALLLVQKSHALSTPLTAYIGLDHVSFFGQRGYELFAWLNSFYDLNFHFFLSVKPPALQFLLLFPASLSLLLFVLFCTFLLHSYSVSVPATVNGILAYLNESLEN